MLLERIRFPIEFVLQNKKCYKEHKWVFTKEKNDSHAQQTEYKPLIKRRSASFGVNRLSSHYL